MSTDKSIYTPFPRTIDIYNNKLFKGNPAFVVNKVEIIDQRKTKKLSYNFKDFYIKSTASQVDDENPEAMYLAKNLPFDFISAGMGNFFISIDDYNDGVATIYHGQVPYYFKVVESDFLTDAARYIIWKHERSLESVQKLEKVDKEFELIIDGIRKCIAEKNYDCLISKYPEFKIGIYQWSALHDPSFCKKYQEGESVTFSEENLKNIKKRVIDWELYKQFFSFRNPQMVIHYEHRNFGREIVLSASLTGAKSCDYTSGLKIHFYKESPKTKWKVTIFSEATAD